MGFYSASSLLQDARRHGVTVRPVDVCHSHWDNMLEGGEPGGTQPALRLGFRQVHGLSEAAARRIVAARLARGGTEGPWRAFRDVADLCQQAGALRALTAHRHAAHWAVAGVEEPTPLFAQSPQEQTVEDRKSVV